MRRPTLVAGSGDGVGYGEECFSWTDWPTQNGMFFSGKMKIEWIRIKDGRLRNRHIREKEEVIDVRLRGCSI
jgi:hypothetical protein